MPQSFATITVSGNVVSRDLLAKELSQKFGTSAFFYGPEDTKLALITSDQDAAKKTLSEMRSYLNASHVTSNVEIVSDINEDDIDFNSIDPSPPEVNASTPAIISSTATAGGSGGSATIAPGAIQGGSGGVGGQGGTSTVASTGNNNSASLGQMHKQVRQAPNVHVNEADCINSASWPAIPLGTSQRCEAGNTARSLIACAVLASECKPG